MGAAVGAEFRVFTDSQAAMIGLRNDQPGPGQELARRGIRVARAGVIDKGAQVQIEWVPGHAGVFGK